MKYSDLVQFEKVIGVKVLTEADDVARAREDVRTYVVSERMSERLRDVIIPSLDFTTPGDKKSVLVVGTYGTGKTHLMSVIAAVAEREELTSEITDAELRESAQAVAGRFKVIRKEIGSTAMSLRDIICRDLEEGLAKLGVDYRFPPADAVTNTKDSLLEMMAAFEEKYPEHGLLLVIDELLDFLRRRRDNELADDLTVLREVGEIARSSRFRFIGGVQETIFDNPRFASAADAVRRVRDRFDQLLIVREDIAFVVKERLLHKSVDQRDHVREHLQRFSAAFEGMADRMDDYIALYPIHPAYLRTFELLTIVEKRNVLATLSDEIERRLGDDVPDHEPGLISYDSYRARLVADPSNRTIPEVQTVLDKANVLTARVEKAIANSDDRRVALRIIDALTVHRLTTGDDIYAEIGPTASELRDDLCILEEGWPLDPTFLRTSIENVISEIIKAVSGQFITERSENGQVFLDVKKDIDYDQKIEERAASLDNFKLDEAYFRALEEVLEQRDAPYVSGYNIWEYQVPWTEHHVSRLGYLFFGAPNQRSTAQPPRDFYLYFIQPYEPPKDWKDEAKSDEVFFRLEKPDDEFTEALRRYAGAVALANESAGASRLVYQEKHQAALSQMIRWLRTHMGEAVSVTYQGVKRTVSEALAASAGQRSSIKDQIDTLAAASLAAHFAVRYPGYPKFTVDITFGRTGNIGETVRQAISQLVTQRPTVLGSKALAGLELLKPGSDELVETGTYAQHLVNTLAASGGRAVTRAELLEQRDRDVWTWGPWYLEPVWLTVVAAALCQLGRLEIGFPGSQMDALGLDRLTRMAVDELEQISHVTPPKATSVTVLRDIARVVGVNPNEVPPQGANEQLVPRLVTAAQQLLDRVMRARDAVIDGVNIWGAEVIDQKTERQARLEDLQRLLDDLRNRTSVGKLNKIVVDADALARAQRGVAELEYIEAVADAEKRLEPSIAYLREARAAFDAADDLKDEAELLRTRVLDVFAPDSAPEPNVVATLVQDAERLRGRYTDQAARAHQQHRLDAAGEQVKRQVREGTTYTDLETLAGISLLPASVFEGLAHELVDIGSCPTFDERKLRLTVTCPECGYTPKAGAGPTARARLDALEATLEKTRGEWLEALSGALREAREAGHVMVDDPSEEQLVDQVMAGQFPETIDAFFVATMNEALTRFEVRTISAAEVWDALFPAQSPTTVDELRTRFDAFLDALRDGKAPEQIRVKPGEGERP